MVHNQEEHRRCFLRTLRFLDDIGYKLTDDDEQFIRNHYDLFAEPLTLWLTTKYT